MSQDPFSWWQHIHGASSHFPIALLIFAFLFDFGSTIFQRRDWRPIGFWALLVGAAMTIPSVGSGLTGQLGWFGVSPWGATSILTHRNLALISGGLSLALALWRIVRRDQLKGREWFLYLTILTAAVGLISYTGLLGAYVSQGS